MSDQLFTITDYDEDRELEIATYAADRFKLDEYYAVLRDGLISVTDWLMDNSPLYVIPIFEKREKGEILRGVYHIPPEQMPTSLIESFSVNGQFMELVGNKVSNLNMLDNVSNLFEWYNENSLKIIGVLCPQ